MSRLDLQNLTILNPWANLRSIYTPNSQVIAMDSQNSGFGFNNFSEVWNGRLAMLGFIIGVGTELLTGQGILSQIGLM